MMPLIAVGPHIFSMLPMSLQTITERTRAKWPAIPRFGAASARQFTGMDEDSLTLEGLIFEDEWQGWADYKALKATQALGEPLPLISWGGDGFSDVFGTVIILDVGSTHHHLRPDGIGRKIEFSIEVASYANDFGGFGGLFG